MRAKPTHKPLTYYVCYVCGYPVDFRSARSRRGRLYCKKCSSEGK